ncbi:hypothetical protein LPTSP4_07830 [Leptospira ryugenii]|uniref:Uncharacterized protein n=1 Tax=Leptospira ryugenii TaxID=1917863 RepID=A0A2P2DXB9_9LEPT|nr:hypothetical protein [Leptospira ryugenii]GBF49273.1 hypothetical protein LPTSP4_07830 [Leptospira ryugenii]
MPSNPYQNKINSFLTDSHRVQATFERSNRLFWETKTKSFLEIPFPTETILLLLQKLRIPTTVLQDIPNLYPKENLAMGMEEATLESLARFVDSLELVPSESLLIEILKQKAIQEIIATIIESGIIEFNRKTNPLFSVIQATGLDKQIKSFIAPFLPNFLPKIASFLHKSSFTDTSHFFSDMLRLVLHAPVKDWPYPPEASWVETDRLGKEVWNQLAKDKLAQSTAEEFGNRLRKHLLERVGEEPLKDVFFSSDSEYESFLQALSELQTKQWIAPSQHLPIANLLSIWLEGILGD